MAQTDGPPPAWAEWRPRLLAGMAIAAALATPAMFTDSFHGLVGWCQGNGVGGNFAYIAPSMVDVFILFGEAVLLLAIIENWGRWPRAAAWASIGAGLAVSVAGNVGRDGWHQTAARYVTFAVAPLALAGLTALGLLVVKRFLHPPAPAYLDVPEPVADALRLLRAGPSWTVKEAKAELGAGQDRAAAAITYLPVLRPYLNGSLPHATT